MMPQGISNFLIRMFGSNPSHFFTGQRVIPRPLNRDIGQGCGPEREISSSFIGWFIHDRINRRLPMLVLHQANHIVPASIFIYGIDIGMMIPPVFIAGQMMNSDHTPILRRICIGLSYRFDLNAIFCSIRRKSVALLHRIQKLPVVIW
jgi:hypothetical protein